MAINLEIIPYFLLLFVRLTSFFVVAPLFSTKGVPNQFKIGLAFFISLIVTSSFPMNVAIPFDGYYILLILKEFCIGIALGFVGALVLYAVQIAGAFIDFQMGFAIANVFDPQTGSQVPIIGRFKYILAILFLLTVDGHHLLINGVLRSIDMIPIEIFELGIEMDSIAQFITVLFSQVFLIALQIAFPIVGALFLVEVGLGVLAKTVPQMNVFVVGLPVRIGLGFILLLLTMPVFFYILSILVEKMFESLLQLISLLGGA